MLWFALSGFFWTLVCWLGGGMIPCAMLWAMFVAFSYAKAMGCMVALHSSAKLQHDNLNLRGVRFGSSFGFNFSFSFCLLLARLFRLFWAAV